MMIVFVIYLLCFYLSIPGLLSKAGYSFLKGLIPIYNIYLLLTVLEMNPIFLIIISLLLIFLPIRMLIVTAIFVFMPFMLADAYDKGKVFSILALVLPFIMFPLLAYGNSTYAYDVMEI